MTYPVQCWVNVESGAGAVLGDGPIRNVISWRSTAQLSKSGTFALTILASDARAALLQPKRVVRCYAMISGAVAEIGAGIVDSIRWSGNGQLQITGSDLLAELRYRSVHDLTMYSETSHVPTKVFSYSSSAWTDMVAAYDGNKTFGSANRVSFTLGDPIGDYLFIGYSQPFNVLYTYQDAGAGGTLWNTVAAELNYGYSDGAGNWPEFDVVSDGQIANGVPWDHSLVGVVSEGDPDGRNQVLFQRNGDWAQESVNGVTAYWIRIDPTEGLSTVSIVEFVVATRSNLLADVPEVMAYAPSTWTSWAADTNGSTIFDRTTAGTYAAFAGELVLSALIKMTDRAGENFRLGNGRRLHWLHTGAGYESSGVRAVRTTGSPRQDAALSVCQIVSLEETRGTDGLITRIYPYGAGNGKARVSLVNATLTMPSGYVMDAANNYIRNTAAESTYGQIERVMAFKDIRSTDDMTFDAAEVCNQLAQLALNYLQRHCTVNYFYRMTVTGLHQVLQVGTTIRVVYREVRDGVTAINIDDDLIILSETHTFSSGEAYTVALDVGTTDVWPATDAEILADMIEEGTVYESHPQPVDSNMIKTVG